MNYKIITDEAELDRFINWLPELKPTEKYYFCLFSRSKYLKVDGVNQLPHIKTDKAQLKRGVSDKLRLKDKLRQLEIPLGCWKQKDHEVPQEALAVYITPNPREMWKATINSMVKLAQCIRDQNIEVNPHQEVLSEIQRTKSRTCWIDFDIDFPDAVDKATHTQHIMEEVLTMVNQDAVCWLESRGGLHLLVDPNKVVDQYKKSFYQNIAKLADQTGDNMIPIPGCTQGMFTPRILNY